MAESTSVPDNLRYTKDHEWVRIDGETAVIGITDHAQTALGDITYVDLPPVGKHVKLSEDLAAVESAKAAADVYAPVSGIVEEVNLSMEEAPEKINSDPYGDGWICKLKQVSTADLDNLLTPDRYRELLEQEAE